MKDITPHKPKKPEVVTDPTPKPRRPGIRGGLNNTILAGLILCIGGLSLATLFPGTRFTTTFVMLLAVGGILIGIGFSMRVPPPKTETWS